MRTVSSSMMAALVVVALFWGNCFSCPEAVLASYASHRPAHECCHKSKASTPGCDTQNLQQFVKTHAQPQAPAMPVVALSTIETPVLVPDPAAPVVVEYPPPDHLSSNSVLRV